MRRVVLDSDAVNPLALDPAAVEVVRRAVVEGRLQILATHILREEVSATPDDEKRAKLQALLDLAVDVPTGGFVFDRSRFDQASFTRDDGTFETLRNNNAGPRHVNDALTASAAQAQGCPLVVIDGRLTKRAREIGIEVLHPRDLLAELGHPHAEEK
jgi:hypothetical protein